MNQASPVKRPIGAGEVISPDAVELEADETVLRLRDETFAVVAACEGARA
jgi:predicted homoserine dehydrogenase-like protein